jgi:4-amino-4-deoxy-L-arabinose transferase-like glycosyltransferase
MSQTRRAVVGGRWQRWAALLLLAILFTQLLTAAVRLSVTIDEGFHITSGYEYLRTGQLRLFDEHVPLAKALFAWPLFFVRDLMPPEAAAGYAAGDLIAVAQETILSYQPIDRVVVACRIPVALLTLLLAATVYRWASDALGPTAGLFALALLTFDPNLLAHGSLATTDLGATAFIFWATWAFARYLRRPSARRWWIAALLMGLAQGAKLTALLILPALGLLALVDAGTRAEEKRFEALARRALSYAGMMAVAALVLWSLYGFEVRPLAEIARGRFPLPAASHVERWVRLQANIDYGRESFLLGQNRMHGWWQYFPLAFLLKTPLPVLILVLMTVGLLAWRRRRLTTELALALFPVSYGLLSLTSTINIGYRHLLPVLPFLFVSVARLAAPPRRVLRAVCAALVIWLAVGTVRVIPHYLTYFNAVAGGPDDGYRFLADSNTDWGQGLKALAETQRRGDLGPVKLSMFTFLDPAIYGVRYEPIAPMAGAPPVLPQRFNPASGTYAISATTLDGVPLPLPSTYSWFRHRTPQARVAYVIFIYQVTERRADWVAQCTDPAVPLPSQVVAEGFGSDALRHITFDCQQSWIIPQGGASDGWYVRSTPGIDQLRWPTGTQRHEWWPDWAQELPLNSLHLSYVQPTPGELPPFAIWEWNAAPFQPPSTLGPIALEETLEFVGYDLRGDPRPGETIEVLTYWRVVDPPRRPLSLMLHLANGSGVPVAVGDGLGVGIDQWQPGDRIVQRHVLNLPPDLAMGDLQVLTGAYWLDDLTRLQAGDRSEISLETVTVR